MDSRLKFRDDGTFKIVQLTDLHIGTNDGNEADARTFKLISEIIQKEMPDLIAITGDLIWSEADGAGQSYRRVLDHISQWDIPFAIVYGNHDSEANITREELHEIQEGYQHSLSKVGPQEIHGVGNYSLAIQSNDGKETEALLYFLDSGDYAPKHIGTYEWIHSNQVSWFVSESHKYAKLPALAFFHMPLPEYNEVWKRGKVSGNKLEQVCCPVINSGLFTAMLETGNIMGTFVGHDHDNDYCGELHGISLCYGRITGYNVYGELERGARVIQLYEGEHRFESWLLLDNGERTSHYIHNHQVEEPN
ncbi:metallophosphoesterase family protein [Lederbergia lenta]|uniref:Calcineurin-like phosphoesterase n=1 Tax=Lederbergia lenta TaxID=1467 RepID=A0A2X4WGW2_LEDLE|nr:metallophosphoesterase family protein [Lederbergia lenta]MEC2322940.1 metallophosphoesterase family protein [Lederbergia lenta]SQI62079.1 Calcineurin-like phosphoesterase [Lederbergia lenta]